MKTKLKTLVLLLAIAVSTTFAQRDWAATAMTAADGEVIRIASAAALGTLTVPAGATVTIVSDGEEPIARNAVLNLSINAGATVKWEAKIAVSGTPNAVSLGTSTGTFEVQPEAIIRQVGTAAGNAVVSTGAGRITVLGGEISAAGTGVAINSTNNTVNNIVTVSGGVVSAVTSLAIVSSANGVINIDGGLIISQGTAILGNVLSKAPTSHTGGVLIAYPSAAEIRISGTREGLVSLPIEAEISWKINDETGGIQYNGNEFFATSGKQLVDGIIHNAADLALFRDLVNAGNNFLGQTLTLGADIELAGDWTPIGNTDARAFRGTFDGNGHSISNLSVSLIVRAGLFGTVGADGQIKNLTVNVVDIVATTNGQVSGAGGLAGVYSSTKPIENVGVNISGSVSSRSSSGSVGSGARYLSGGLIGQATATVKINNSYSTGNVSSSSAADGPFPTFSGGLIGQATATVEINNSYSTGNVSSTSPSSSSPLVSSGGLVGQATGAVEINNSYSTGNISSSSSSSVSYVSGSSYYSGGLIGQAVEAVEINNSYSTGNISSSSSSVSHVSGSSYSGGLIGQSPQTITITDSYSTGDITSSTSGTSASSGAISGGLVGQGSTVINISRSYSAGIVLATLTSTETNANLTHTARSGGLVGHGSGILGVGVINIENSFASGDVAASNASTGATSGITYSGGLVGQPLGRANIKNSYVSGGVSASGNQRFIGGISGTWTGGETESVYFRLAGGTTHATGGDGISPVGIEGASTAQLRDKATFIGWNFTGIWGISNSINNGFPFLRHFNEDFDDDDDNNKVFVAVEEITDVVSQLEFNGIPSDPMMMIGLDGTVLPADATNRNIVWSYVSGTATGFVNGENLIVASAGTFEVRATIINGLGADQNYVQYFSIVVTQANLPSCDENAHAWADNWTTTIPATCEAQGVETRICTNENCTHPETRQIAQLTGETCQSGGNVSIRNPQNSDNRHGILIENAVVSDKAQMRIILPNGERVAKVTAVIYDNLGNTVFTKSVRRDHFSWNLSNTAGRFVGNGTYLIVVEAKGQSGGVYRYSSKIGVKR